VQQQPLFGEEVTSAKQNEPMRYENHTRQGKSAPMLNYLTEPLRELCAEHSEVSGSSSQQLLPLRRDHLLQEGV